MGEGGVRAGCGVRHQAMARVHLRGHPPRAGGVARPRDIVPRRTLCATAARPSRIADGPPPRETPLSSRSPPLRAQPRVPGSGVEGGFKRELGLWFGVLRLEVETISTEAWPVGTRVWARGRSAHLQRSSMVLGDATSLCHLGRSCVCRLRSCAGSVPLLYQELSQFLCPPCLSEGWEGWRVRGDCSAQGKGY